MDVILNAWLDAVMSPLEWVFGKAWVAPFVLLPPMLVWAGWLHFEANRKTRPYLTAAQVRIAAIRHALGDDSNPDTERVAFSRNYGDVLQALTAGGPGSQELVHAWHDFRETIVDESAVPIQNTIRPFGFFHRTEPKQNRLHFWSNIFVGIGLILTFIGLIVALRTASKGMEGGNVAAAQEALKSLLVVAGAKFFTSVGGIGASIWLRFAESGLTRKVGAKTRALCELLERGLVYIPPQRLAAQQLEELREQTAQLKYFNQDVAFQLADRINIGVAQAFAPVTASLASLSDNMASVTQGIGAGARDAIEKVSGDQMRQLSDTLLALSERLNGVTAAVGDSGAEAAQQIREAGEDFRVAASEIRGAFDLLAKQVDGLGTTMAAQSDAVANTQNEALERMLSGLEEAQKRSAATLEETVKALKVAAASASTAMQEAVGGTFERGVAETGERFRSVLEESGEGLRSAAGGLAKAVTTAADQIDRASEGFARSSEGANNSAKAMSDVANQANVVTQGLISASTGFSAAAEPVADAARSFRDSAAKVQTAIEAARDADARALAELKALAEGIRQTQTSAEMAWRDYRARFEGVDKALERTTAALAESLDSSLKTFSQFASKFDSELGSAVGKLGASLDSIDTYADALDKFVDESRRTARERV